MSKIPGADSAGGFFPLWTGQSGLRGGSNGTSISISSKTFSSMTFDNKLRSLESIAGIKGVKEVWDKIVIPWKHSSAPTESCSSEARVNVVAVEQPPDEIDHTMFDFVEDNKASEPSVGIGPGGEASVAPPPGLEVPLEPEVGRPEASVPSGRIPTLVPSSLAELVKPFDAQEEPWQYKKYSADNALWQSAALRRRAHPRRANVSLGTCSVDLSGPHEPTPRPGTGQS